jgi:hypothetical protein
MFRDVLEEATCQLKNSHRLSPLLSVMETYYRYRKYKYSTPNNQCLLNQRYNDSILYALLAIIEI